jgi:hypothetical protein
MNDMAMNQLLATQQAKLKDKDAEIKRLKALCARAAEALEADQMSYGDYDNLVAELRKVAQ